MTGAAAVSSGVMRAAVLVDVGRFEIRDVPVQAPASHEVVVRVRAVGLCGTDLHIVQGHANYNNDARGHARPLATHPQILGHEIAGEIVELGSGVHDAAVGDRVVVDQGRTCVSEYREPVCEYCRTGDSHQCEHYAEHGITGLPGGFAEYVTVPAANTVRVTTDIAPDLAALAEPLGCIVHSSEMIARANARYALGRVGDAHGVRSILVCGGGPAGLLFVQYLRNVLRFDGLLMLAEPNARKRALAEQFGAETIDPSNVDLVDAVAERTRGRRAELLIEATGSGALFASIHGLIRKQATVLLYGHGHSGVELGVLNQVQFLEPTFVSPAGASGGHASDRRPLTYAHALRLIEEGSVDVGSLITHRYPSLDSVPEAFMGDHRRAEYVKGVVLL
ncbi:MAG TPA: alcohol dehydrogenase catalytic domain-containing protein [Gemmatimonadaceae bacterium]|jgi:L-iditol 2-dehydrogenase|nr:alcohol dehydrogenase catalytic domain-containing protein [Gemmatimonadaceae bacterium]